MDWFIADLKLDEGDSITSSLFLESRGYCIVEKLQDGDRTIDGRGSKGLADLFAEHEQDWDHLELARCSICKLAMHVWIAKSSGM